MTIKLTGLDGTNPLGFLAAIGVLDVVHRASRTPTLRWTDDILPTPVLSGVEGRADLIALLDEDRVRWKDSVTLHGPTDYPLDDAKPSNDVVDAWARQVAASVDDSASPDAELFAALVAQGAIDGKGATKPTHLHFTAGQQRFLRMARDRVTGIDPDRLAEAVFGPWREDSPLPSLSWNSGGERLYALRAIDPTKDKRLGVPGADWLALLGLVAFPVCAVPGRDGRLTLRTSVCDPAWKASALRWPLWTPALGYDTVRSLVAAADLVGARRARPQTLRAWSVMRVLEAPIRRTDLGGYGSFGAATVVAEAAP